MPIDLTAPDGFEWARFNDVLLLKPMGWLHREKLVTHTAPAYELYATSPEEFSEVKAFETGFTIQIIRNADQFHGLGAARLAGHYLAPTVDILNPENALLMDTRTIGELVRTVIRYIDAAPGVTPLVVHKFVIANTQTEDVHIFTFECPKAAWEESWAQYGNTLLGNLRIVRDTPANEPTY